MSQRSGEPTWGGSGASRNDERSVLLDQLLERLPQWLELVSAEGLAPTLRDRRDRVTWRLFTAGEIELGATPQRVAQVRELLPNHPFEVDPTPLHFPPRVVKVDSFFMRERVLTQEGSDDEDIIISNHAFEARRMLERFDGATLPSEAQFEYAWAVVQLEQGEWKCANFELCRDGWSVERYALEHVDVVPGGPGVVRMASFDRASLEWVLPSRRALTTVRLATVRPTITTG
ncbi:MAG: hypothetical protein JNM17_35950 [Archangium sp.]|nr:hypothetical protein [Archangium sp.]